MKKAIHILFILLMVLASNSLYSQDDPVIQVVPNCTMDVYPSSRTVNLSAGSFTISVDPPSTHPNCRWEAYCGASWVTSVSPSSGTGYGQVTVRYNSYSGERRSTSISVGGRSVQLIQELPCNVSISPAGNHNVESEAGSFTITVTSNKTSCSWNAHSNKTWATVSPRSGTGNGTVTVSYIANEGTAQQAATITIAGHSFQIIQCPPKEPQKSIAISTPTNDMDCRIENRVIQARDKVTLNGTFSYNSATDAPVTIRANDKIICSANYLSESNIQDPALRTIDKLLTFGRTEGISSVTSTGGATYQIPIPVNPGTLGVSPSLFVIFNSQSGDGILGKSWHLGGLSSISRTPQNHFQDRQITSIKFNDDDRFSLDGNRLVLISGEYGKNGSEYRTESETFAKIKLYGSFTSQYFTVEYKNGKIVEYGKNFNSRVNLSGKLRSLSWRINKVTDKNNNYIEYRYKQVGSEIVIDKISYTGNSVAGITPYNDVQFYYETRNDSKTFYIGGGSVTRNLILRELKVFSKGSLQKRFSFKYGDNRFSKLHEIEEYSASGDQVNSTIVGWENISTTHHINTTAHNPCGSTNLFGDFNGDGRIDLLMSQWHYDGNYTSSDKWRVYLGQAGKYFSLAYTGNLNSKFKHFMVGDFDNDGDDDIYMRLWEKYTYQVEVDCHGNDPQTGSGNEIVQPIIEPDPGPCYATYSYWRTRLRFYSYESNTITANSNKDIVGDRDENDIIVSLDFDGNGKQELLFLDPDLTYDHIYGLGTSGTYWSNPDYMRYTNFNGNGKTDIMIVKNGKTDIYEHNNGKLEIIYSSSSLFSSWHKKRIFQGDFNGDGHTDFLSYNSDKKWYIYFCTGNTFVKKAFSALSGNLDNDNEMYYGYRVADMNGDGISDILEVKTNWSGGTASSRTFNLYKNYNMSFVKESHVISTVDGIKFAHFFDVNGDGIKELILKQLWSNPFKIISFDINEPKYVSAISDGYGVLTKFYYDPLSYRGVYHRGDVEQNPEFTNYTQNMYVVSQLDQLNNQNLLSRQKYYYTGSVIDRGGKGFLGFGEFRIDNHINNISIINKYDYIHGNYPNEFYFTALKESIKKLRISGTLIEHQTFTNSYDDLTQIVYSPLYQKRKRYFPYVSKVVSNDNLPGIITTKDMEYDDFGNITKSIVSSGNEAVTTSTNTYITAGGWCVSKPDNLTVTSEYTGEAPFSKTMLYTYYGNGNLKTTSLSGVTNTFNYGAFGNVTGQTQIATGIPTSTSSITYGPTGRFVKTSTNTLNQTGTFNYNNLGQLTSETGIDGLTTSYAYDSWGKLKTVIAPNGKKTITTTHWATDGTHAFYVKEKPDDFPEVKINYDYLGRKKRTESTGFNGLMYSDIIYDTKGQVQRTISPYYVSSGYTSAHETTYGYDEYGRITSVSSNGLTKTTSYNGKTITETFPSGETKVSTYDATGNPIAVNSNGDFVNYSYYSHGQLQNVTTPGSTIGLTYDTNGYKDILSDPDAGPHNFDYNVLGQLTSKTTPIGNYSAQYDGAGRLTTETENGSDITYTYIENGNGINQIDKIKVSNVEFLDMDYDGYGRVTNMTERVGDLSMSVNYIYDIYGRVSTINYPEGFGIIYLYNSTTGGLEEIRTNSNEPLWKFIDANSHGQITSYVYGNGLITNLGYDTKNFISTINTGTAVAPKSIQDISYTFNATHGRFDDRKGIMTEAKEIFGYHTHNQLNSVTSTSKPELNFSMTYHATMPGVIDSKSDVGTYNYTQERNAGPHAISEITNKVAGYNPVDHDLTYTPFGKVSTVTQGNYSVEFTYGPDHQRKMMKVFQNSVLKRKIYYFGNYERHEEGGTVRHLYYIYGANGFAAIYKKEGATGEMYYMHTDHLGSLHVITDHNQTPVARYYYNAWGDKKHLDKTVGNTIQATNDLTWLHRGFTGHEHITEIGLINMNGRVYDPDLGMFISPDPYIQALDMPVNFNRYAYALNNPLVYTDPDGEWIHMVIGGIIGGFTNLINNRGNIENFWDGYYYFNVGGVIGSVSAAIGGGISSSLSGSSFWSGFLGSEAASGLAASSVSSSSFTNGAISSGVSGVTNDFLTEFANSLYQGESFNDAYVDGMKEGFWGGLKGSILGGLKGGRSAYKDDRNFWNGGTIYDELGRPIPAKSDILGQIKKELDAIQAMGKEAHGERLYLGDKIDIIGSRRLEKETWLQFNVIDQLDININLYEIDQLTGEKIFREVFPYTYDIYKFKFSPDYIENYIENIFR